MDSEKAYAEDQGMLRAPLGSNRVRGLSEAVSREKSAIEHELTTEAELVQILHKAIDGLEQKVTTVRSQMPRTDEARDVRDQMGSSLFYHRVYENNDGIMVAIERLRTVTRELEV